MSAAGSPSTPGAPNGPDGSNDNIGSDGSDGINDRCSLELPRLERAAQLLRPRLARNTAIAGLPMRMQWYIYSRLLAHPVL
ncbi:hypothetical protein N7456_001710 [Penicillium angulare]|uniref:Uncharacterized protein n=1 Tax=Penicillium angulare TaxID=116970 RepID=A0A9W9KPK8_9EURO|nr:hypothetical protein N7456_001710 [Penicillium angulare]